MNAKEIIEAINKLPIEERKEVFSGKNAKLTEKDNTIKELQNQLKEMNNSLATYKQKEQEEMFKSTIDKAFTKVGNLKDEYKEDLVKLSGITSEDDEKSSVQKIKTLLKNEKYKIFMNEDSKSDSGKSAKELLKETPPTWGNPNKDKQPITGDNQTLVF